MQELAIKIVKFYKDLSLYIFFNDYSTGKVRNCLSLKFSINALFCYKLDYADIYSTLLSDQSIGFWCSGRFVQNETEKHSRTNSNTTIGSKN